MVECMTVADTAARAQRYRPPPTAAPLVGLASCQHAKTRRSGVPKKGRARRPGNLVDTTEVRMIKALAAQYEDRKRLKKVQRPIPT